MNNSQPITPRPLMPEDIENGHKALNVNLTPTETPIGPLNEEQLKHAIVMAKENEKEDKFLKGKFFSALMRQAALRPNEVRRAGNKVRKARKKNKLAKAARKINRLGRKSKTKRIR